LLKGFMRLVFIALVILPLGTGCAIVKHYPPYYGRVIDTETKEPLEGAAVLAVYLTQKPSPGGPVLFYREAQETVTDKNGEFKIPSLTLTNFKFLHFFQSYPDFTIFKPEYGCYPWHKDVKPRVLPAKQYVTIELPRLKTREERLLNTDNFPRSVPDEKMKKLIELNNIERINLGLDPTHTREKKK